MKKKLTFFILAISMSIASSLSFAQISDPIVYEDFKTIDVYSTNDWIEIDGIDDEACWAKIEENQLENVLANWGVEPVPNIWGYAVSFKAIRDQNYIYFFIKVKDNTYIPWTASDAKSDTGVDNIEVTFFPDPTDKDMLYEQNDARPRGLSQLRLSVGSENNRASGGGFVGGKITNNLLTGYEYKTVKTDDGYNLEAVIPWSALIDLENEAFAANLETGKKILFEINAANCVDYESNTRVIILGWSGIDHNSWKLNSTMGEMVFKGNMPTSINKVETSKIDYSFINNLLSIQNADNAQVNIYDISGKALTSLNYTEAINLSNLQSGIYIVNVAGLGAFKIIK